ncbi:Unknown protein [Striga hermonthica]|uniref:Uncharacterized protein n=1 Tax=Striga hermonthica TaxID=68872 RepID=A0A9N7MMP1_STRHE|nr:Unknown protein [Striga hermonthica]
MVTKGFVHSIFGNIVRTLHMETEVMTETLAPIPLDYLNYTYMNRYLSAGKALTLVDEVKHGVFRVWEMVCGDYCYWREWEDQIVLGSWRMREIRDVCRCEDKYLVYIHPVGWLQQMEVLVFKGSSINEPCKVFYVVIVTGDIGWIQPSSNKEVRKGWLGNVIQFLVQF